MNSASSKTISPVYKGRINSEMLSHLFRKFCEEYQKENSWDLSKHESNSGEQSRKTDVYQTYRTINSVRSKWTKYYERNKSPGNKSHH